MNKRQLIDKRAGFTLVEILLSIIALALVVFVGFYVYRANQNVTKTVQTSVSTKTSVTHQEVPATYLPITELGVKLPLNSQLTKLEYLMSPSDNSIAGLSTSDFVQAVNACLPASTAASSFPAIVSVTKHQGAYNSSQSFSQNGAFDTIGKQFEGSYLTYSSPDGGYCQGSQSAAAKRVDSLFNQLKPQIVSAVKRAVLL